MNYEDFLKLVSTMSPDGKFSFGVNWTDYVKFRVTEDIINLHFTNLKNCYRDYDFTDKSVLDIGCGSGLSSLSFNMLGCKKLTSIDVDMHSIEAAHILKNKFATLVNSSCIWNIENQSILNTDYVKTSERYDLVYSWGVLHHTGDMWTAIKNASSLVKPGGILHLALYISGTKYSEDLLLKHVYNLYDDNNKKMLIYNWLYTHYISNGVDIFQTNHRGMNKYNDCIDWLGGLPYEVCDPDILDCYLEKNKFDRQFYKHAGQGGNFIAIYKKQL